MMIECEHKPVGYGSSAYIESLSEFGNVVCLPSADGWLLERDIPGSSYRDAMGSYPLFCCDDWSALARDLDQLPDDLVSVSLVADPFGSYDLEMLNACFDVVNPFKCHYIVELQHPLADIGSRRHRKQARRAFKNIRVEVCKEPSSFVDEWCQLYQTLQTRYGIKGIRGFSKESFAQQLGMPDVVVLQAFYNNQIVGAQIYFQQGEVVHCHLGAVNDAGYRHGAFYAMDHYSFEFFSDRAMKLDLGGGAGMAGDADDGLSLYKKGWCSEVRPVYFCGRIMNPDHYAQLAISGEQADSGYFPSYRAGEFN